jgi:hypothetical protein
LDIDHLLVIGTWSSFTRLGGDARFAGDAMSEDIGRQWRRRKLLSLLLAQLHLLPTRRSDSRSIDAFAICPGGG